MIVANVIGNNDGWENVRNGMLIVIAHINKTRKKTTIHVKM